MRHHLIFLLVLVAVEAAVWLAARWETWQGRYKSPLEACLALHWRLVSGLFMLSAGVLVRFGRMTREALVEARFTALVIEAATWRYWQFHGVLESRVAKADRGLRRRLRHRQLASVNPPKEIISGAVLPPGAGGAVWLR